MLGSSNANYNTAYQNALSAGQGVLNPMIQQQSNALLNSNFERGMSGTSGGALQTQALQNSFNTAELQNQGQAVGQANTAFMNTNLAGNQIFNSGAGQLGNFNYAGANFGNQGMQAGMGYNMFSPQLAGAYNQNALGATQGFGNINTMGLQNANFGLAVGANQGNQMNRAAMTQGSIANTWNGGMMGAGSTIAGAFGNMLTGGNTGMMSGIGGAISNYLNGGNYGVPNAVIPGVTQNGGMGGGIGNIVGDVNGSNTGFMPSSGYTDPTAYYPMG